MTETSPHATPVPLEDFHRYRDWAEELYGDDNLTAHRLIDHLVALHAEKLYPQYTWICREPKNRAPVVDQDGYLWVWEEEPGEPGYFAWTRHLYRRMGTLVVGPDTAVDFDDVLSYGPVRLADEKDYARINEWPVVDRTAQ